MEHFSADPKLAGIRRLHEKAVSAYARNQQREHTKMAAIAAIGGLNYPALIKLS